MADAAEIHPVTCRTRKLSLPAPMVLCGVRTGEQEAASLDFIQEEVLLLELPPFLRLKPV